MNALEFARAWFNQGFAKGYGNSSNCHNGETDKSFDQSPMWLDLRNAEFEESRGAKFKSDTGEIDFTPPWDNAPAWAKFLARDRSGAWYWYSRMPELGHDGIWRHTGGDMQTAFLPGEYEPVCFPRPKEL